MTMMVMATESLPLRRALGDVISCCPQSQPWGYVETQDSQVEELILWVPQSLHVTLKDMDSARGNLYNFFQFFSLGQGKGFCEVLAYLSPFLAIANPLCITRLANNSMMLAFTDSFVCFHVSVQFPLWV